MAPLTKTAARTRGSARRTLLGLGLLALLLGLGGCLDDFEPASRLSSLRILAIRATEPEARPGETLQLDALVFEPPGASAPPEGTSEGARVAHYEWRVCFLASALINLQGGGGPFGGGDGDEQVPVSCFDLKDTIDQDGLWELLLGGGGAPAEGEGEGEGEGQGEGEDVPSLDQLSIVLGEGAAAEFFVLPLPPFPGVPSFCTELSDEERLEQGGREFWMTGMRYMVSLRVTTGEESVTANKRLVVRPAADEIPDAQQGQPFRTPRLCATPEQAAQRCARNVNPDPPVLAAPNGEWSGDPQVPIRMSTEDQILLLPAEPTEADQQAFIEMSDCGTQITDPVLTANGGEAERLETRFYSWFANIGSVVEGNSILGNREGDRNSAWKAPDTVPEPPAPGDPPHMLYVVARDGRGGVSWTSVPLEVTP